MSRGFLLTFGLSQKVNLVLMSGLMVFLAVAGVRQSRQQHALVRHLNSATNTVVNELAAQMASDRAECESMMENAMADVVARFSPELIAARDFAGLQAYADLLAKTPNVDAVEFLDDGGAVVARGSDAMAMGMAESTDATGPAQVHYVLERPVEAGGRSLGRFRMVVTDRFLRVSAEAGRHTAANAVQKSLRVAEMSLARADLTMTLATLALAGLMGGLSTVLFQRLIGKPLGAIARAMQTLAGGQMDAAIPGVGRRDEIGAIAAAS